MTEVHNTEGTRCGCALRTAYRALSCALVLGSLTGLEPRVAFATQLDTLGMLRDVELLSADSLQGRATGTDGNRIAREYIVAAFSRIGLEKFGEGYATRFTFMNDGQRRGASNIVGYVRGSEQPDRFIAITAHYDHLGVRSGSVYNGADDNASGTAALIAMADYFARNQPRHSILFVAFDAEELGLQGAKGFVARPPVPLSSIVLNVNMDMVSHADEKLVVAGTYHYPFLREYVDMVAPDARVTLEYGHDSPDLPSSQDWTSSSDHGPFHEAGIPFLYFGVEDHEDYHKPTDDFDTINRRFYIDAVSVILAAVMTLDENLAAIAPAR